MVLDEVFGSDFGMDTLCEDFYRAFKEYLSTLGQDYHMFSRNFLCNIFLQGTQQFSFEIKKNANATVYYIRVKTHNEKRPGSPLKNLKLTF